MFYYCFSFPLYSPCLFFLCDVLSICTRIKRCCYGWLLSPTNTKPNHIQIFFSTSPFYLLPLKWEVGLVMASIGTLMTRSARFIFWNLKTSFIQQNSLIIIFWLWTHLSEVNSFFSVRGLGDSDEQFHTCWSANPSFWAERGKVFKITIITQLRFENKEN